MSCLQTTEHVSGNVFIRPVLGNVGTNVGGHTHNFDHTSIVIKGAICVLFVDESGVTIDSKVFIEGQWFLVKAKVRHFIECLENETMFLCVYSHRDAQGDVVQSYEGPFKDSVGSDPAYQ